MRTCRIKPSADTCYTCNTADDLYGTVTDCSNCAYKKEEYELVSVVSGLFRDYAIVIADGEISKVPIDRIFDVKEKGDEAKTNRVDT